MPRKKKEDLKDRENYFTIEECLAHFDLGPSTLPKVLVKHGVTNFVHKVRRYYVKNEVLKLAEEFNERKKNRAVFLEQGSGTY